jgi:hypothetical protein
MRAVVEYSVITSVSAHRHRRTRRATFPDPPGGPSRRGRAGLWGSPASSCGRGRRRPRAPVTPSRSVRHDPKLLDVRVRPDGELDAIGIRPPTAAALRGAEMPSPCDVVCDGRLCANIGYGRAAR